MSMTNTELRQELKKHGVNVGPVTDSTRRLYLKRLEKLEIEITAEKSRQAKSTKKGPEKKANKIIKPTSRERSASPVLRSNRDISNSRNHNKNSLGYSTDENEDDNAQNRNLKKEPVTTGTRSTRQDSRTSIAISKDIDNTPVHRRVQALSANTRKSASLSPKRRSAPLPEPEEYSDDSDDASEHSSIDSWVDMASGGTNTSPSLANNQRAERLEKFRAEIAAWKKEVEKENPSNILSQRKLGSGRQSNVLQKVDQNDQTPRRKTASNGAANFASKIVTQSSRSNSASVSSRSLDDPSKTQPWTLNFSSFLPIGTCIFFLVLALLYATMKYDPSLNSGRAIAYEDNTISENKALHMASMIYDYVGEYEGEKACGPGTNEKQLTIAEVVHGLKIKGGKLNSSFLEASDTLIKNPDWGVFFHDKNNARIESSDNFDRAFYINSVEPILSGWCRFTRAVQKVLLRIILIIAVGVLIWLGMIYRRYRIARQRDEREQMYIMVQKILDVLRKQYDTSEANDVVQPYLPILHVRDMIVPPQDRKKMARVWERAKQFLSASETRIRVENQRILGEDYLVWRWIQATSPAKRHTATSRVWQGEAFDIKAKPMICPTPCLKIRNLFDPDMEVSKNWIQQIQDSILEKCQGNNEILRICVEKESKEGLVYLLCATNQAAGHAFQALHGAWFDGRLVTVKFIRLHRFHHRFPDSVNQSNTPMRPTSAVPVSTMLPPVTTNDAQLYKKLYPTLPDD